MLALLIGQFFYCLNAEFMYYYGVACGRVLGEAGLIRLVLGI